MIITVAAWIFVIWAALAFLGWLTTAEGQVIMGLFGLAILYALGAAAAIGIPVAAVVVLGAMIWN